MNDLAPAQGSASPLERWLTGPRFAGLPAPGAVGVPRLSFEFFPPRTAPVEAQAWAAIQRLAPLAPHFVSVTYGAGGSVQDRTHRMVARILRETTLTPAAHLTCVGASRGAVDDIARRYWDAGVRHIVALRGDPPPGERFSVHPDGYRDAADLVAGLRRIASFEISVAAYPEVHPEAASPDADLDNLRRKLDAGASRAITQLFFDTDIYLRFIDRCHAKGITAPVVPGIMPISNFAKARRFVASCGASVPRWLDGLFEGLDTDEGSQHLVGAVVAAEQVRLLQANGVDEFHFYTLNRAEMSYAIAHLLGARPRSG
ncbi:methylenetetrahydrofolate reductase (NADPH) [Endobacter medicaginis]|uniref:Methylenetetrahydrofolate reductase n=2 Tax=Endobacter medicaginis TaxID=1181271 RepID=A0A839UXR0_9PROT|nr:methylenetetrahydrofolate reductase [NAD(P)H] [Endobacter medicaginis]MBB3173144.1 methylenetetrahydrofolate reductase (NADPH) [Endobacter medicaginis]MCX5476974.1 methylenetetrahydrofolate reductase [NAD(P)H] [Endobacter medicaginis]